MWKSPISWSDWPTTSVTGDLCCAFCICVKWRNTDGITSGSIEFTANWSWTYGSSQVNGLFGRSSHLWRYRKPSNISGWWISYLAKSPIAKANANACSMSSIISTVRPLQSTSICCYRQSRSSVFVLWIRKAAAKIIFDNDLFKLLLLFNNSFKYFSSSVRIAVQWIKHRNVVKYTLYRWKNPPVITRVGGEIHPQRWRNSPPKRGRNHLC